MTLQRTRVIPHANTTPSPSFCRIGSTVSTSLLQPSRPIAMLIWVGNGRIHAVLTGLLCSIGCLHSVISVTPDLKGMGDHIQSSIQANPVTCLNTVSVRFGQLGSVHAFHASDHLWRHRCCACRFESGFCCSRPSLSHQLGCPSPPSLFWKETEGLQKGVSEGLQTRHSLRCYALGSSGSPCVQTRVSTLLSPSAPPRCGNTPPLLVKSRDWHPLLRPNDVQIRRKGWLRFEL